MKDYEESYNRYWKGIVENNKGEIIMDQVMRELHDYMILLDTIPKLYDYVTGGRCTKPFTDIEVVKQLVDEHYQEIFGDGGQ